MQYLIRSRNIFQCATNANKTTTAPIDYNKSGCTPLLKSNRQQNVDHCRLHGMAQMFALAFISYAFAIGPEPDEGCERETERERNAVL